MSPTESMALTLAPVRGASLSDEDKVQKCIDNIREASLAHFDATKTVVETAVTIGANAAQARDLLPKDITFKDWVEANFGKGKRPLSIQWVRVCINAAKAHKLISRLPNKAEVYKALDGVRALAGALDALQNERDPLADREAPAPKGRPSKAAKAAKQAKAPKAKDDSDNGTGANDLAEEAQKLAKLAKTLEQKEERLNKFEEALNERERLLSMREAALGQPGTISDATPKAAPKTKRDPMGLKPDASIDELKEKAKAASAKAVAKASPKAPPAATSPANGKVRATPPARAKKAPVIDPGTVASIQDAAARAVPATIPVVDHSASNALIAAAVARGDFDAPKADEAGNEAF